MSKEEVDKTELVLELLGIAAGIVLAVLQTRKQFRPTLPPSMNYPEKGGWF